MRALMVALCLGVGLAALGPAAGHAADTQPTAQQQRMKDCNPRRRPRSSPATRGRAS